MNKIKINYFIDLIAFISFLVTAITGIIIFLFLPPGEKRGGIYNNFLGYSRHELGDIHNWAGIIMLIATIIHIILHWKWIIVTTKTFFKNTQNPQKDIN